MRTQLATPLVTRLSSHALGCQCGSRIPPGCNVISWMLASCPLSIGKLSSCACCCVPPSYVMGGTAVRWNRCDSEVIVSEGMRGSPKRAASSAIDSSLVGSQDDDRVVELLERLERLCGNAENGGQHPGRKLAEGFTDADVVFGFGRADVLDDHYLHVGRAAVLEVGEGTLGCEHDVADMLVEALMVAVPVDDPPSRDSAGDDVELPRAGMPVRLADTPGHQRERH